MIIAVGLITAIILIKYKPIYKVSISGEEIGYIKNKQAFEENIKQVIINEEDKSIDSINLRESPEYELKFIDRTLKTNENEIATAMKNELEITYKYYEIALNDNAIEAVNTIEEAEQLVNEIKDNKQNEEQELNFSIVEKYTEDIKEVETNDIEIAKSNIEEKVNNQIEQRKEEENTPKINGIKLAVKPVSGTISSRYGVSSRIRKSTHTGLDIAAPSGTPIKVVSDGTVTSASYSGSYGNLVKVDHGNGIETWYAHTSEMYVTVGQKVTAGEVIAAVGSTGNSTGAHLHLEIRINGSHVNPQQYLYK
ncbi:MAG: peptidoglycan DD-metalloendopeptidase family protein [Clostridia bacterium]|nr:peptidoglycan DD-metalloendopeptidase family protein [Clostridia bacterium]